MLGLDHPFDDGEPGEPVLSTKLDTDQYTVMSYTAEQITSAYASTPQMLDILAIQYIYGANMTTRTGNDVYKFSTSAIVNKTIWDAGGDDTLDFSGSSGLVQGILKGGETFMYFHPLTVGLVSIAYGVTIENVIGSTRSSNNFEGNDADNRMIGGNWADQLKGWEGNDHLEGRGEADILAGNSGNDWIDGGAGQDNVNGGDGNDTLLGGTGNDYLSGNEGDDFLDTGAGNDNLSGGIGNDTMIAGAGNDGMSGDEGDDIMDAGLGNDIMYGGAGNDTYFVSAAGDVIDEGWNLDTGDVVYSTATISLVTLGQGAIEHASLVGTAAINVIGNDKNNLLTGNTGANKLDGGIGADTLTGGKGNDMYVVDNAGDEVKEDVGGAAGGVDTVQSSVDFDLTALANVEKLTLAAGFAGLDGTGNSLDNTLTGNEFANTLNGGGGKDTMAAGAGDDFYVVDNLGDVVTETIANSKGGGIDTVESIVTFSLAKHVNIENLSLLGGGDINGTGNALANTILGNSGKNILDGGTGADILKGGSGNDVYVIDTLADVIDEEGNTDTGDEVRTSAILPNAIGGIEIYTNTGSKAWDFIGSLDDDTVKGGTGNDRLGGSNGNDVLFGGAGNDGLAGHFGDDTLDGGAGKDFMNGGEGNDTYIVDSPWDFFFESINEGTDDRVISSVSFSLGLPMGIEHITLVGAAIEAAGNDLDNSLTGNALANKLNGGVGADTMTGGAGNDTYVVDDLKDEVVEAASAGIDTIQSSIDNSLATLVNIEKLTLALGAGNIDGTGNTLNNTLLGNEGANILDGGAGNDTMTGGKGDDTYVVDSAKDVVNETIAAGGGTDTVQSAVTFSLATRANIENLTLIGDTTINGTGNALDNTITGTILSNRLDGGGGNDTLIGGFGSDTLIGGAGNDVLRGGLISDTMTGGAGRDVFDYDSLQDSQDLITDFQLGASGDVLDFHDLLSSAGALGKAFDGYLTFQTESGDTVVYFDFFGTGSTSNSDRLVILDNVILTEAHTNNFIVV